MMTASTISSAKENGTISEIELSEERAIVDYAARQGKVEIDSRFGKITLDYDNQIIIEKGMLGIPDMQRFCLLAFPAKKFAQFRLLQCLEDDALSFIMLPITLDNHIIDAKDLKEAAEDLHIPLQDLDLLLVVNVYREANYVRMSVNARAPVFINRRTMQAEQAVLRNNRYMVRHMLKGDMFRQDNDNIQQSQSLNS